MDIRKGDWVYLPVFKNHADFMHDRPCHWIHGNVIYVTPETKADSAYVYICTDFDGEYATIIEYAVLDERRSEAVRAAVANAAQEDAGQLQMFGGV